MATLTWRGDATAIPQKNTWVFAGNAWAAGETITIKTNSKTLLITLGTGSGPGTWSAAEIIDVVQKAIMATSATDNLSSIGTEIRNVGGQQIAELREITASQNGSNTVTITGHSTGKNFSITMETTSVTGTIEGGTSPTSGTSTQAPNGPNWVNTPANWGVTAINAGDDFIVDKGETDILYGLDQLPNVGTFRKKSTYRGHIGLLDENVDGGSSAKYKEWRPTHLILVANNPSTYVCEIGDASVSGTGGTQTGGRTRVGLGGANGTVVIDDLAPVAANGTRPVSVYSASGNMTIIARRGHSAIWSGNVATVKVGREAQSEAECSFKLDATLVATSTIEQLGGKLELCKASTNTSSFIVRGGRCVLLDGAHNHANGIEVYNRGVVEVHTALAVGTLWVYPGGTVDWSKDHRTKTLTKAKLHRDAAWIDPAGVADPSSDFDFIDCHPGEVNFSSMRNGTWTFAAI